MATPQVPEPVGFLTVEGGADLVIGVAIEGENPGEVLSLILQRTPKYEGFLLPEERSVRVSHEGHPKDDEDHLRRLRWVGDAIEIETRCTCYRLDVARVDPAALRHAARARAHELRPAVFVGDHLSTALGTRGPGEGWLVSRRARLASDVDALLRRVSAATVRRRSPTCGERMRPIVAPSD